MPKFRKVRLRLSGHQNIFEQFFAELPNGGFSGYDHFFSNISPYEMIGDPEDVTLEPVFPNSNINISNMTSEQLQTIVDLNNQINKQNNFLAELGWKAEIPGIIRTGRVLRPMGGVFKYMRWNPETKDVEIKEYNYDGDSNQPFKIYNKNGEVSVGFDGADLSIEQLTVLQSWGYDNNGTLESFTGVGTDSTDGGNYRLFQNPETGEFAFLLPQRIRPTLAFARLENRQYTVVVPNDLKTWVHLATFSLDENATIWTYLELNQNVVNY